MRQPTALVLPHELNLGPSGGRTPPGPGKGRAQTGGQGKPRAVRNVHVGEGCKEILVTDGVSGMELGKGRLNQLASKSQRSAIHPLMQRFGRDLDRVRHLRRFGRQLR